jgi:hypothetical protein
VTKNVTFRTNPKFINFSFSNKIKHLSFSVRLAWTMHILLVTSNLGGKNENRTLHRKDYRGRMWKGAFVLLFQQERSVEHEPETQGFVRGGAGCHRVC